MNVKRLYQDINICGSKFFLTISKITFAGGCLGALVSKDLPYDRAFIALCGFGGTILFFIFGVLLRQSKTKDND